jgi:SAM-dependent methyltransferase
MAVDPRRATVFGQYADEYARWRPTYPSDALDWLLPDGSTRAADVGAGTGQLTGALLERGLQVVAVEPNPEMLRVLRTQHPAAEAHLAWAEVLPLDDASVDAVLVGDAWHWFSHAEVLREVRRVLRPGGWLALAYHMEDPVEPWEHELRRALPDRREDTDRSDEPPTVPGIPPEECEWATFPWTWHVTPEQWRGYLATGSAFILMDDEERELRLDAAAAIVEKHCQEAGTSTAPVHHHALCVRWRP